jgi:predicted ATPase
LGEGHKVDSGRLVTARSELIGRDDELAQLSSILEDTIKREGGLVLIEGEAGVGKTRLVDEFVLTARAQNIEIVTGNCIEGGTPYLPFINALSGILDRSEAPKGTGIKEAFIIHTDGRLLVHKTAEDVSNVDDDVMSSTLTAIREFIGHSFSSDTQGNLNEVTFGRHMVIMEQGKTVYLAIVVDPTKTEGIKPQIRRLVEDFEAGYGKLLVNWKGELTSELMASERLLEKLIHGGYMDEDGTDVPIKETMSPQDRTRLFDSIARKAISVSKKNPLIIFLDDLQWMDPSSLDLLQYMARVSADERILIIGAYRPEDLVDNMTPDQTHDLVKLLRKLSREKLYQLIKLKRLNKDQTDRMVNSIFPANTFTLDFCDRVFSEAKGNPLFTEEILRELVESSVIFEKDQGWANTQVEHINLPNTIKDVVMRRLGRLGEKKLELLQYAAAGGLEFHSDVLQKALGWEEDDIIEELDDLVKVRVLKESAAEGRYTFDHEVIREVIYENLSRLIRRRIHEKVAQALLDLHKGDEASVCFELAHHFANTRDRDQAIKYNLMAGEKAMKSGASAEAIRFLEMALANLEPDVASNAEARTKQLKVFYDLGRCHGMMGDWELALSFYGKAIDEAHEMGDRKMEAWALNRVGDEYKLQNEFAKAMDNYGMALSLFKVTQDAEGQGAANRGIGQIFWRQAEFEIAIEHFNQAIAIFSKEGMMKALGSTLVDLGNVNKVRGDKDQALEKYAEGLKILEEVGDKFELARIHNNLGSFHLDITFDYDKALEHFTKCLELAKETDDARAQGYAMAGICSIFLQKEDVDRAEEYARAALKIFLKLGEDYMVAACYSRFGVIAAKRGNYQLAVEEMTRSVEMFRDRNLKYDYGNGLKELGTIYKQMGLSDQAEETLTQALNIAEEIGSVVLAQEVLKELSTPDE